MDEINLHPSVLDFKKFVNKHPKLIKEIRKSGRTWQEYYEKWALLGEEDSLWSKYKHTKEGNIDTTNDQTDLLTELMELKNKFDFNKVQNNIVKLSQVIEMAQMFLGNDKNINQSTFGLSKRNNQPNWFRD